MKIIMKKIIKQPKPKVYLVILLGILCISSMKIIDTPNAMKHEITIVFTW